MIAETGRRAATVSSRLVWRLLLALGAALFAAGALLAPHRVAPNLLLAGYLLLGLGVGGLYFLAIHYASGAGWATALKRIPEALTRLLPPAAVLIAAALLVAAAAVAGGGHGSGALYPWMAGGEETAAFSPFKAVWLAPPFFFVRAALYLLILAGFGRALRRGSLAQDRDADPRRTVGLRKCSVAFLVVGSFVVSLASFDWFMALEPHWYSTMFGVYHFAGHFTASLAAIVLLVIALVRRGVLPGVGRDHLHDLGKLLFAMCTFWMYIWFSQAMLIWYGNLAEEAVYFNLRLSGGWAPLLVAVVLLNWVIPFFVLLSRRAKRNPAVLSRVALVVLAGHWLDLYLMIFPPLGEGPAIGLLEIGGALALPGLAGLLVLGWLRRVPALPAGDPTLEESLRFHQ